MEAMQGLQRPCVSQGKVRCLASLAMGLRASFSGQRLRRHARDRPAAPRRPAPVSAAYDVLVVGGGAAGMAVTASLLARDASLRIGVMEPSRRHYYQPGWTLLGAGERVGLTGARDAERATQHALPSGAEWIRQSAATFDVAANAVVSEEGVRHEYAQLVVCPGIKLNWAGVTGLEATLGANGVTSNYKQGLAAGYTWPLVQGLKKGRAVFTQPPMPIKCAGAPQKAMYLSADAWRAAGTLGAIDVQFHTAAPALFGVKEFVPGLMKYVEAYGAHLHTGSNLKAVDGPGRTATFEVTAGEAKTSVTVPFDFLHVSPPMTAPDFVRSSQLADAGGWIDVDPATLRHKKFANVWGLGDAAGCANAKTAAAVRKQAPVVAVNLLEAVAGRGPLAAYDGYGSCPLTVERGKVILAEFGYGGKLLPTFPVDPTVPRELAWWLKQSAMPSIYWELMGRGIELFAAPKPYEGAK